MTMALWRIAQVTPAYSADDLSGKGAEIAGGRWNSKGTPLVYASQNIALATLETIAHFGTGMLPLNRYLVRIDVPDELFAGRTVIGPPPGWDAEPYGLPSIQAGDAWAASARTVLAEVPSVIVPEERNVLINPRHPDAPRLGAHILRKWIYDPRLRKDLPLQ